MKKTLWDSNEKFSIQGILKFDSRIGIFFWMRKYGSVWSRTSRECFNSQYTRIWKKEFLNPFINGGAIVIADMLVGLI
jgi:glutaminase